MFVCIYASQLSSSIGLNRYISAARAAESTWQRIDPKGYLAALRRNNRKTDDDILNEVLHRVPDIQCIFDAATTSKNSSREVESTYEKLASHLHAIEPSLRFDEKVIVQEALKRNVFTTWGNQEEFAVLEHLRESLGMSCVTDETFYKEYMGDVDGHPWYIGGRVDALTQDDPPTVIEIKNRVRRLFGRAPLHEQVQLQTYMRLVPNTAPSGVLVECYKPRPDCPPHINMIEVRRDTVFWDVVVMPKLTKFVHFVVRLVNEPRLQNEFLKSRRPTTMIWSSSTSSTRNGSVNASKTKDIGGGSRTLECMTDAIGTDGEQCGVPVDIPSR
jgi:hypothetical protein